MTLLLLFQDAGIIRVEADKTKVQATELRRKADDVASDVGNAENRLASYETQANDDKKKAVEVDTII